MEILCIAVLVYFVCKSVFFIKLDIREKLTLKNGKIHYKGFPALAIIYLFFSICFIFFFITSFDEILSIYLNGYKVIQGIITTNSETTLENSLTSIDNMYEKMYIIVICLMLSAFSINFSKSLSTMNALEFDLLGPKSLHELLNSNGNFNYLVWERWIRTFTGLVFILVEKELYDIDYYTSNNTLIKMEELQNIMGILAILIFFLYISLTIWFYVIIRPNTKKDSDFTIFNKYIPFQFVAGIIISGCFLWLSYLTAFNFKEMNFGTSLFIIVLIVAYLFFFISVFMIESKFISKVKQKLISEHPSV